MFTEERNFNIVKYLEVFFIVFLLLQPFLDFISYFGNSFSLIIRVGTMGIGLLYLLIAPNQEYKWTKIIYLILLGIFIIISAINNYFVKEPYSLVQEFTYGIKSIYVIEMLIVYITVFKSMLNKNKLNNLIGKIFLFNTFIISIIMVIAEITNTGKSSYNHPWKIGHSGWFYSANDLSAILALSCGIVMLYLIKTNKLKIKLMLTVFMPFLIWSILTIGTKVGLGAIIISLAAAMIVVITYFILKRWKRAWINLIALSVISVFTFLYVPYSAVGYNIGIQTFDFFDNKNAEIEIDDAEEPENEPEDNTNNFNLNEDILTKKALSGRDLFLNNIQENWGSAPLSQKILGMGPGGNYKENLKLIEMDFLDWIYGYGIIGSILLFSPYVLVGILILSSLIRNKFQQFNSNVFLFGVQSGLGIGIAMFAGHIFLNPASGIYFSVIFGYLYVLSRYSTNNNLS